MSCESVWFTVGPIIHWWFLGGRMPSCDLLSIWVVWIQFLAYWYHIIPNYMILNCIMSNYSLILLQCGSTIVAPQQQQGELEVGCLDVPHHESPHQYWIKPLNPQKLMLYVSHKNFTKNSCVSISNLTLKSSRIGITLIHFNIRMNHNCQYLYHAGLSCLPTCCFLPWKHWQMSQLVVLTA